MKHKRKICGFLSGILAIVFLLTGCESVVTNAKPPVKYPESKVIDGNFIDLSDPQAVYELYQQHYAAMQGNKEYTSYAEFRSGLDIFAADQDWSKNFISFDIVGFDHENGNLVYALMTTNMTNADSEYEYIADAEVTVDENGKIHVTEKITKNENVENVLIAAVGFYSENKQKNTFFFIDHDYSAGREDAGDGKYNLIATLEGNSVAVLYKEESVLYNYNSEKKTYVMDTDNTYSYKELYSTKSFVTSAQTNGIIEIPENDMSAATNLELEYSLISSSGITTIEDQERIMSYMNALNRNNESMANAFLKFFVNGYTEDQLDSYLASSEKWTKLKLNVGKKQTMDDLYDCLHAEPIKGGSVELTGFERASRIFGEGDLIFDDNIAIVSLDVEPGKNTKLDYSIATLAMATGNVFYYVPFYIQIQFTGEQVRTYNLYCKFWIKIGSGLFESNPDWGDREFTIRDVRYTRNGSGNLLPTWLQLELAQKTSSPVSAGSSSDFMERLNALESSAKKNATSGSTWMDVNLTYKGIEKSYSIKTNSQVTISSLEAISDLMDEERERVRKEIEDNNEKYRINRDVTSNITAEHIEDLWTMFEDSRETVENASEDTKEEASVDPAQTEETETPNPYSALSARFSEKDEQTNASAELIAEKGEELIKAYTDIYDNQEKIRQQEFYINACQFLKVNEVYDQMLSMMDSKFSDYIQMSKKQSEETALREALDRLMADRGLSAEASEKSVDEWMLPASMIGEIDDTENWDTFCSEVMDSLENSQFITYLTQNREEIKKQLNQTILDLKALEKFAITADSLVGTGDFFCETADTADSSENEDTFFDIGYRQVLNNYQNALNYMENIISGKEKIDACRKKLHSLETDEIKISRFDLEISEAKKEELLAECDRMEMLLKMIHMGSSDVDRNNAAAELEATNWQIDVDVDYIDGQIVQVKEENHTRAYREIIWTATINRTYGIHNSYLFTDEPTSLYFDEENDTVVLMSDAPAGTTTYDAGYQKLINGIFSAGKAIHGDSFMKNMDQALITSVKFKKENTSVRANLPDNQIELVLLSQSERSDIEDEDARPKWSFMALPYSKLGLESSETVLSEDYSEEKLKSYSFISAEGINNEVSKTYKVKDYETLYKDSMKVDSVEARDLNEMIEASEKAEAEAEEIEYEVKIRRMLRDDTTIFLDNPDMDWENPEKSIFYFLNISLDEGIQLYALHPDSGTLQRQKTFSDSDLKEYTEGCWFMGWWYPDGKTEYNDEGELSGGKLILLGLSKSDMVEYSSDGEIRELVTDDIRHAKFYTVRITSDEMNLCKFDQGVEIIVPDHQ